MLKNLFKDFEIKEWVLYLVSLIVVVGANLLSDEIDVVNVIASIFGVTMLIFIAKGKVFGQVLAVIFGLLYSISALRISYYSEIITYLGMSVPIAVFSIITWLKNPSGNNDGAVKIRKFTVKEFLLLMVFALVVTIGFYFILKVLNTPNLVVATISIATSFSASYLMLRRISYYAIAYSLNDIVLIVLWIIASVNNLENLTFVACFFMFLFNDLYAFVRWKLRESEQTKTKIKRA